MDEYITEVVLEDKEEIRLVTYGNNVEEVLDNLVQIRHIKYVKTIVKKSDGSSWKIPNKDALEVLRNLRDQIENESLLKITLNNLGAT